MRMPHGGFDGRSVQRDFGAVSRGWVVRPLPDAREESRPGRGRYQRGRGGSTAYDGRCDALATYFEARSCVAAHGANEHGGASGHLALVAARACYDTLMECGVAAKRDLKKGRTSPAVERLIECNILLSGVGFESGGLALAHAIANGLTILPECKAMHGEAVAFGLVVQMRLERAPELDQVLEFCRRVGLPTTLEELGLGEISDADLQGVANAVFRNERNMANEQTKVTKQKLVQLMCEA